MMDRTISTDPNHRTTAIHGHHAEVQSSNLASSGSCVRRPEAGGYLFGADWISCGSMTKRLIDVDDEKLDAVKTLLGTATLKATVNAALDEVLALDQRRRALLAERGVDLSELADADARRAAWG